MSLCTLGSPGPSRLAGVRASSLSSLHAPPECSPYHCILGGVGRIAKYAIRVSDSHTTRGTGQGKQLAR